MPQVMKTPLDIHGNELTHTIFEGLSLVYLAIILELWGLGWLTANLVSESIVVTAVFVYS